jgi:anti-sigma factor ChrR (cupin superfamily)
MKLERLRQLASLYAAGALSAEELEQFERSLAQADANTKAEIAKFQDLAALVATSLIPEKLPPANLKAKLLGKLDQHVKQAASHEQESPAFSLMRSGDEIGWRSLPIPGASVKLLSIDRERGYAVVLGKLAAGARYPAHRHFGSEEIYMLSGDLTIEGETLRPGDFHHAAAGTIHGVNYSEHGCTLLAVVSVQDLVAQGDMSSSKWVTS